MDSETRNQSRILWESLVMWVAAVGAALNIPDREEKSVLDKDWGA
jgi:hypothetical protein